jgi:Coenzyme PQQ synthesis protein D (PqqD)
MRPATSERLSQCPGVVSRRLGDEMVLVNLETNRIFRLNRTGARLWELLEGARSTAELEELMEAEFDVGRDELRAELDTTLPRLAELGLVAGHGGG